MRSVFIVGCGVVLSIFLGFDAPADASPRAWNLTSPDHAQTFSYGSEQNRAWIQRDSDRHLALILNFTNDPYVDNSNPRRYDSFTFNFPHVTLGSDGRTFAYHAKEGRAVPVAVKSPDFLGITEIKLLPTSFLRINKTHGFLTVTLIIGDRPSRSDHP